MPWQGILVVVHNCWFWWFTCFIWRETIYILPNMWNTHRIIWQCSCLQQIKTITWTACLIRPQWTVSFSITHPERRNAMSYIFFTHLKETNLPENHILFLVQKTLELLQWNEHHVCWTLCVNNQKCYFWTVAMWRYAATTSFWTKMRYLTWHPLPSVKQMHYLHWSPTLFLFFKQNSDTKRWLVYKECTFITNRPEKVLGAQGASHNSSEPSGQFIIPNSSQISCGCNERSVLFDFKKTPCNNLSSALTRRNFMMNNHFLKSFVFWNHLVLFVQLTSTQCIWSAHCMVSPRHDFFAQLCSSESSLQWNDPSQTNACLTHSPSSHFQSLGLGQV